MKENRRNPLLAALLSLIAPGLGHVYSGQLVPGLSFAGASMALGSFGTLAVTAGAPSLHALLIVALVFFILWIAAAIGAFRAARAVAADFTPREYNRWYVYALLASFAFPVAANWTLAIRENVAQIFHVPAASMIPTVPLGAHVVANKLAYRKGPVRRGDIVVFSNPNARYADYIKRVVALPGDEIEMRDDEVFVNGTKLEHRPAEPDSSGDPVLWETDDGTSYPIVLGPPSPERRAPSNFAKLTVPNGHCFVLGDNRRRSIDSREFGPLPLVNVVGRVDRIW
jgi:signal peptidase I